MERYGPLSALSVGERTAKRYRIAQKIEYRIRQVNLKIGPGQCRCGLALVRARAMTGADMRATGQAGIPPGPNIDRTVADDP